MAVQVIQRNGLNKRYKILRSLLEVRDIKAARRDYQSIRSAEQKGTCKGNKKKKKRKKERKKERKRRKERKGEERKKLQQLQEPLLRTLAFIKTWLGSFVSMFICSTGCLI